MASITTAGKAEAIRFIFGQLLGSTPPVVYRDNYAKITFTPEQAAKLRTFVDSRLSSKQSTDIRIDLITPLLPLALKYLFPALGVLFLGLFFSKRRK